MNMPVPIGSIFPFTVKINTGPSSDFGFKPRPAFLPEKDPITFGI